MKVNELLEVIESVPTYVAVFRLKSRPNWLDEMKYPIGCELIADTYDPGTFSCTKTKNKIALGASYVEFVGYRKI